MQPHPDLPVIFTTAAGAVARWGDDIWEIICAEVDPHAPFRVSDVAPRVAADLGFANRTAHDYVKAVLHNVSLELDGRGVVQPRGRAWVWNHDNALRRPSRIRGPRES